MNRSANWNRKIYLLNLFQNANKIANLFYKERLVSGKVKFHAPVDKSKYNLSADAFKQVSFVKEAYSPKIVEINRNMLRVLSSFSFRIEKGIDIWQALCFLLCLACWILQSRWHMSRYQEKQTIVRNRNHTYRLELTSRRRILLSANNVFIEAASRRCSVKKVFLKNLQN